MAKGWEMSKGLKVTTLNNVFSVTNYICFAQR